MMIKVQRLGCFQQTSDLIEVKVKDNKFVCPLCHSLIVITYYYDSTGKHPNIVKCAVCKNEYGIVLTKP